VCLFPSFLDLPLSHPAPFCLLPPSLSHFFSPDPKRFHSGCPYQDSFKKPIPISFLSSAQRPPPSRDQLVVGYNLLSPMTPNIPKPLFLPAPNDPGATGGCRGRDSFCSPAPLVRFPTLEACRFRPPPHLISQIFPYPSPRPPIFAGFVVKDLFF